jgi:hypothetical protein
VFYVHVSVSKVEVTERKRVVVAFHLVQVDLAVVRVLEDLAQGVDHSLQQETVALVQTVDLAQGQIPVAVGKGKRNVSVVKFHLVQVDQAVALALALVKGKTQVILI